MCEENRIATMKSNFGFVYEHYNKSITEPLREAEKAFWVDYIASGNQLRKVLEAVCDTIITDHQINMKAGATLGEKSQAIDQRNLFVLKKHVRFKYQTENGHKTNIWSFIWRNYGNVSSHGNLSNIENLPKVCFENQLIVFEIVYKYFYEDAKRKGYIEQGKEEEFNFERIPIGNNQVVFKRNAVNRLCEYEFVTESRSEAGTLENYGLIRMFKKEVLKNNIDDLKAQTREYETCLKTINQIKDLRTCCSRVDLLNAMTDSSCDFYIIKYVFIGYPKFLSHIFFKMQMLELQPRIDLCYELALQLRSFHDKGFAHRNLNYNSVVVCKDSQGKWIPGIINFEYSKQNNSDFTVYGRIENREISQDLEKYIDNQILNYSHDLISIEDWKLADIFSLGALFYDILMGSIRTTKEVLWKKMKDRGLPDDLATLISNMHSTVTRDRPNMDIVVETIKKYSSQSGD